MIRERINKRAGLIAKLEEWQKVDLNALGESEPIPLTKEIILKGVLKCCRRDFESVFWRHKASGKVNQLAPKVTVRGKLFQLYDHSTVIHAVRAHENRIECYKSEKKLSDSVIQYLRL